MGSPANDTNLTGEPWASVNPAHIIRIATGSAVHYLDACEIWNGVKHMHESTHRPANPYTREPLTCDQLLTALAAVDLSDRNNYLLAECLETLALLHPRVFVQYVRSLLDRGICTRLTHSGIERLVEVDAATALRYVHMADYESAWVIDMYTLGGYSTILAMLRSEAPFSLGDTGRAAVRQMALLHGLPSTQSAVDFLVAKAVFGATLCLPCLQTLPWLLADAAPEPDGTAESAPEPETSRQEDIVQFARELMQLGLLEMAVLKEDTLLERIEALLTDARYTHDRFREEFVSYIEERNPTAVWLLNRSLGVPHPILKALNAILAEQILATDASVSCIAEAFIFITAHISKIAFLIESYIDMEAHERAEPAAVLEMVRSTMRQRASEI